MTPPRHSGRLNSRNTEVVRSAKIGTFSPRVVWVHEADLPLEEGVHFRYLEHEPTSRGFYPDYGMVHEVRDRGPGTIYFVKEGSPAKVEALDV